MVKENSFLMGPCVEEPSAPKKAPLRKGKSPKRCQWQKKRGGFEEVPRLAATIVAGNRLARRWAGCHGEAVTEGSTHRTPCYANASGGSLSFTGERKGRKNAANTHGFGQRVENSFRPAA